MRSRHADDFNHDPWARTYDAKVQDEANPIRAGYAALLAWALSSAQIAEDAVVLDLGAGTGNTAAGIPMARRVIAVDVSEKMLAQAPRKLAHLPWVEILKADLLEVFERNLPSFDAILATYSIHHLTEEEKRALYLKVHAALKPGGRVVFGDLMFEDQEAKRVLAARWTDDERTQVLRSVDEEFPFYLDRALPALEAAGLHVCEVRRFSDLSWGIVAEREGTLSGPSPA